VNRYEDKRVIITGAAQGIGLATAKRMLDEGAFVLGADIKEWEGTIAFQQLASNDRFKYSKTDVTSKAQIDLMVAKAVEAFGGVDVLVSNAGVAKRKDFFELTEEDLHAGFQINLISMILCGQAVCKQIRSQGTPGAIVNMSSVNAIMAMPGYTIYNVSKGGIEQLTRVMSLELAPLGIRVNAVGPGTILTELARNAVLTDEESRNLILSRTPLGRFGEAEEVASVIAFLASDDATYVTGETVFIDGGRRALNYVVPVRSPSKV
jgi:glucose 1-dehydrogenase